MTKFGNSEFSDKPTNYYNLLFKDGVRVIDNNTLVALTLLIAQSNPKEKDILIMPRFYFIYVKYYNISCEVT